MPSALSVSKAYSISFRLPSVSGGVIVANRPKRPGMIAHELGAVLVDLAAELAGLLGVSPPGAGLDLRQHRRGDAALVHVLERHLHRPFRRAGLVLAERLAMRRRQEVVMHVDLGLRCLRAHRRVRRWMPSCRAECGDAAGDEFPSAERRAGRADAGVQQSQLENIVIASSLGHRAS